MTFQQYQTKAINTVDYPKELGMIYSNMGLQANIGLISYALKNVFGIQHGQFKEEDIEQIKEIMGDALWYFANLANDIGISLDEIALTNISKIESRNK